MVSSVKSRPNHYQSLGVDPMASADEISDAFAKKMSLFAADPLGRAAQICIAYETLRDPTKRREHDRLLGLAPERKSQIPQWKYAVTQPRWAPFIASAEKNPAMPLAKEPARALEPQVTTPSESETSVDPRLAAIAASVRELAKPAGPHTSIPPKPQSLQPEPTGPQADMRLEEVIEHIRSVGRAEKARLHSEQGGIDWKRPALTLGVLVLGAGVFGALAGLSLKGDETPGRPEAHSAHFHPVPAHRPQLAQLSPPVSLFADEPPKAHAARPVSEPRSHGSNWRQSRASLFEQQIVGSLAADTPATGDPQKLSIDQPQADTVPRMQASLPLSNAVIARTIERIGYPCGEVAATSAAEGEAAGVFKVTCTSGHSYRATPVAGRYHFRRVND